MDQVSKWIGCGSNGSGRENKETRRQDEQPDHEDRIIRGLMERLAREIDRIEESRQEKPGSYLDQDIDVSGLDVPERDE